MKNNWHGLMKVLEVQHLSKDGEVLYREGKILNLLHTEGEEFIVSALFAAEEIPENYYLGLDNRTVLDDADTLSSLISEPTVNSYERQPADSTAWAAIVNNDGYFQANSPIVTFRAIGGSWGPVRNIFLATSDDASGFLISSAALSNPLTVANGEQVSMRLGFAMRDCST